MSIYYSILAPKLVLPFLCGFQISSDMPMFFLLVLVCFFRQLGDEWQVSLGEVMIDLGG